MSDKKAVLLTEWGEANFSPPPSLWTLKEMGRRGRIIPAPVKSGGAWYVAPDAKLSDEPTPPPRRSAAIPARTELYRHYDDAGNLLYIGISLSTAHRLGQHRLTSKWSHRVATITIERFATRDEALAAELRAIQTESPLFNKIGKGQKAPSPTVKVQASSPDESPLRSYFRSRGYKA
jgi:hypothetical protein